MGLARAYKRWRHGRGFGVHSPYAFRMVTDVLRLPSSYFYYAYTDIARERVRLRAPISLNEALLIFRLAVEFAPARVAVFARNPLHNLLRAIVRLAAPQARITDKADGADMVIAFDPLPAPLAPETHAYLACGALVHADTRAAAGGFGHIYRSRSRAVVAARAHLPFQVFEISF